MEEPISYFKAQYQLIRQSRSVLFDYCKTIPGEDFLKQNNAFGRGGSIRNLFVHIANTYEFWIIKQALEKNISFTEYATKNTMQEIEELFDSVDHQMLTFSGNYASSWFSPVNLNINGIEKTTNALELFTHVITHEFHHKGQILSLSRHLGYTPVDTDVLR